MQGALGFVIEFIFPLGEGHDSCTSESTTWDAVKPTGWCLSTSIPPSLPNHLRNRRGFPGDVLVPTLHWPFTPGDGGGLGDVHAGLGSSSELEWVRTSAFAQMTWQEMEPDEQVLSFCASHHAAQGEKSWMKYIGVQFWATQLGRKRPNFQIFFSVFRSLMAAEVSGATYMRKIYEDVSWSIICGENCRKGRGNRCNTP